MSDEPADRPDDGQNPFKGTPFEQFFDGLTRGGGQGGQGGQGFGFGVGGPGGAGGQGGPGGFDLNAIMSQMQHLMAPHEGPVNWELALETARRTAAESPDPSPTQRQRDAVADGFRLADHWLDSATELPSGVSTSAAWSRAEWIENTLEVWKGLVEPIAARANGAVGDALPEEARAMAGPLMDLLGRATGAMVASQVGSGLGTLAGEVLSASDVGLPLGPAGRAAVVPANVAAFAEGLDVSSDDVLLYLALREAAHQRLFAGVPWLREHLLSAVTDYAGGIELDLSGIEEQVRGLDMSDPASLQQALEGGLFDLKRTPAQEAALQRLEITLALVEGWVDEVVGQATAHRMPAAEKLQEAVRRRRASGGPAEQTFSALVGLELRPRRLRDASTLWGSLRTRQGAEARDGVWTHANLLPTAADLDDPLGFRESASAPQAMSEDDFDAELRRMLEKDPNDDPGSGPADDSDPGPAGRA